MALFGIRLYFRIISRTNSGLKHLTKLKSINLIEAKEISLIFVFVLFFASPTINLPLINNVGS